MTTGASMRNSGRVIVRETHIGRGVFAAKAFVDDDVIGEVRGRVIRDPDYASTYCIDLGAGLTLEPRRPFRYLNHCCEPNAALYYYDEEIPEDGVRTLYVHALRDIAEGEELSIDYAWPADAAIPCLCGSPRCRGWVVNEAERRLLPDAPGAGNAASEAEADGAVDVNTDSKIEARELAAVGG